MVPKRLDILFMKARLLRLASETWKMSHLDALDIFEEYNILEFIDDCWDVFHMEGDLAILDDINDLLRYKGCNI